MNQQSASQRFSRQNKEAQDIMDSKMALAAAMPSGNTLRRTMRCFGALLLTIFLLMELMLVTTRIFGINFRSHLTFSPIQVANPADMYTLSTIEIDGKRVVLPPQPGLVPPRQCNPDWAFCPSQPGCQYGPLAWINGHFGTKCRWNGIHANNSTPITPWNAARRHHSEGWAGVVVPNESPMPTFRGGALYLSSTATSFPFSSFWHESWGYESEAQKVDLREFEVFHEGGEIFELTSGTARRAGETPYG
jgi:hypothetical protein